LVAEWLGRIGPQDEVTLEQAAEMLDVTPDMVATLIELSALPARTNGADTRISLADIEVFRLQSESDALRTSKLDRVRWAHRRLLASPAAPPASAERPRLSTSPDTAPDVLGGCVDVAAG
jgi:hypothetical protein